MKKYFILLITVSLNVPFFYSCNPDTAMEDQYLYENQQATGDDDEPILPPDEEDNTPDPGGNNYGFGGL